MREVITSRLVRDKIEKLEYFLVDELKLSESTALKRSGRMRMFIASLRTPISHAPCRFKHWRVLGYRCAVFEKDWVFAYEIAEQGIIIRDMSHVAALNE